MNFKEWLQLLSALFVLLAVDPKAGAGDAGDAGAGDGDDDAGDEDQGELDLDAGDAGAGDAGDQDTDDPVALKAARDKATKEAADAKAEGERHRLEAEDLRRRVPPPVVPPTEEARRRETEDRELADPKLDANRRWQIEANRTLRETKSRTDATLAQAQDLSDKANFDLSCATNKRFAAVKGEVEEELKKARSMGQNLPREAMAYYLLGKKVATAPEKKAAAPAKPGSDRGTAVRSDVRPGGKMTDHQKRAKRLENVNI